MREALRLYPIAPVVARMCNEATTVAGKALPKGAGVHINIWHLHHDAANFPEPEVFRPQRFIDAAAAGKPDLHPAYMPFGHGPRNCIAFRFAQEEAFVVFIRMYQRFVFRLDELLHPNGELKLKLGLTISPKDGLHMRAIRR